MSKSGVKPTLLLIEDHAPSAEMLSKRLEKQGYRVLQQSNGRDATTLLEQVRPDLILLDLSLPGIDGWTLAQTLKAGPKTRMIPIVAVTAHVFPDDRQKALQAGCDEHVPKPVVFERLLLVLDQLLHRIRL